MSIASDFFDMAVEMLDDPEIGCDGVLTVRTEVENPSKPWEPTFTDIQVPLRVFYTNMNKNTVNGSLILAGEQVFITYPKEGIQTMNLQACPFVDHMGKKWSVNAVESTTTGNETVILTIKVGA